MSRRCINQTEGTGSPWLAESVIFVMIFQNDFPASAAITPWKAPLSCASCLHCRVMHLCTLCITCHSHSTVHHKSYTVAAHLFLPHGTIRVTGAALNQWTHAIPATAALCLTVCLSYSYTFAAKSQVSLREVVCVTFSVDHIFVEKIFWLWLQNMPSNSLS